MVTVGDASCCAGMMLRNNLRTRDRGSRPLYHPSMFPAAGRPWRLMTMFAGATAVGAGLLYILLPWRSTVEFDVVGLLWIVINAPKLAAGALSLGFAAAAVFFALRWLREL